MRFLVPTYRQWLIAWHQSRRATTRSWPILHTWMRWPLILTSLPLPQRTSVALDDN